MYCIILKGFHMEATITQGGRAEAVSIYCVCECLSTGFGRKVITQAAQTAAPLELTRTRVCAGKLQTMVMA